MAPTSEYVVAAPGVAWVHPSVAPEGNAYIRGPAGTLAVRVRHDRALGDDVVVVPYGRGVGNPNRVVARDALEAFTGQPISNGSIVQIEVATD